MSNPTHEFNSSMFNFTPKGSYYNDSDTQLQKQKMMLEEYLNHDRMIFGLSMLLESTEYAFGCMSKMLLQNPYVRSKEFKEHLPIKYNLNNDYEEEIILYRLRKSTMAKAFKNLLMLKNEVNNSRERRIILRYLFERDVYSIEQMALKYKIKIKEVLIHCLGENDVLKLRRTGYKMNRITRYNSEAYNVVLFCFNEKFDSLYLPKLQLYCDIRECAIKKDLNGFMKIAKKKIISFESLMTFNSFYKLGIDLEQIYESGKMSEVQKVQNIRAKTRVTRSVENDINYNKQDIYTLYKLLYTGILDGGIEKDELEEVAKAIVKQSETKLDVDFGDITVILDCSRSMEGSSTRKNHPILTSMVLLSKLPNIKEIVFSGGRFVETGLEAIKVIPVPSGNTALYKDFLKVTKDSDKKTIVFLSDGYENTIKGLCNCILKELKLQGKTFNILHINPVFAAETGNGRQLFDGCKPIAIDDYKGIQTAVLFEYIMNNKEMAKKMLVNKYNKLLMGVK